MLRRFTDWLASTSIRRPLTPFLIAGMGAAFAAHGAMKVRFSSDVYELLPNRPAANAWKEMRAAFPQDEETVFALLEWPEGEVPEETVRAVADQLANRSVGWDPPGVGYAPVRRLLDDPGWVWGPPPESGQAGGIAGFDPQKFLDALHGCDLAVEACLLPKEVAIPAIRRLGNPAELEAYLKREKARIAARGPLPGGVAGGFDPFGLDAPLMERIMSRLRELPPMPERVQWGRNREAMLVQIPFSKINRKLAVLLSSLARLGAPTDPASWAVPLGLVYEPGALGVPSGGFSGKICHVRRLPGDANLRLSLAGGPIVAWETEHAMRRDLIWTTVSSAIAVALILCIWLGGWRSLVYTVVPLAFGLWGTLGAAGALGITITPLTAAVGAMLVGLGIDFTIHLVHRYREECVAPARRSAERTGGEAAHGGPRPLECAAEAAHGGPGSTSMLQEGPSAGRSTDPPLAGEGIDNRSIPVPTSRLECAAPARRSAERTGGEAAHGENVGTGIPRSVEPSTAPSPTRRLHDPRSLVMDAERDPGPPAGEEPVRDRAIRITLCETNPSLLAAAITTAAAMGTLALADFRGLADLGLLSSLGILICLVATWFTLPPLLQWLEPAGGRVPRTDAGRVPTSSLQEAQADERRHGDINRPGVSDDRSVPAPTVIPPSIAPPDASPRQPPSNPQSAGARRASGAKRTLLVSGAATVVALALALGPWRDRLAVSPDMTALRAADNETLDMERRIGRDFEMPAEPWTICVSASNADSLLLLMQAVEESTRRIPDPPVQVVSVLNFLPVQAPADQERIGEAFARIGEELNTEPGKRTICPQLHNIGLSDLAIEQFEERLSMSIGLSWTLRAGRGFAELDDGDFPPRARLWPRSSLVRSDLRVTDVSEVFDNPHLIELVEPLGAQGRPSRVPGRALAKAISSSRWLGLRSGDGMRGDLAQSGSPSTAPTWHWLACILALPEAHLRTWADREVFRCTLERSVGTAWRDAAVTGPQAVALELTDTVEHDIARASLVAALAVLVLTWLTFRSVPDTAIALTPVLLGLVWAAAILLAMGQSFHAMNLPMIPLILGMGVDDGIHLTHRWRTMGRPRDAVSLRSIVHSTGRAIAMTSITTIAGFGSLMFAQHRGLASMGLAVSVGMATCLVASLFVWPAVVGVTDRGRDHSPLSPEGAI